MSTDTIADNGEAISIVEPLIPEEASKYRALLNDLAVELASQSAGLRSSLPEGIRAPLADLVRSMNCYYSNLIEGHNTHPIDIERALNKDFSADIEKRNLQLEAVAHIEVQRWIDAGGLSAIWASATTEMISCGISTSHGLGTGRPRSAARQAAMASRARLTTFCSHPAESLTKTSTSSSSFTSHADRIGPVRP